MKINLPSFRSSIITCFCVLLFNFLFSMIAFLLIWYWAIPNVFTVLPALETRLESMNDEKLTLMSDAIYAVGACLTMVPSTAFAYRISKQRKKAFFAYSKGRISYVNGIKLHFQEYGFSDIVCMASIIVLLTILYTMAGDVIAVRFFPMAFWMFEYLGVVLGFLTATVLTALSMLCGVFFSQKRWRAEYFIGQ